MIAMYHERSLPNDLTCQLDYKANPLFIDLRGKSAAILSKSLDLPDWIITENKIDIFDKSKKNLYGYVAFNKSGLSVIDAETHEQFVLLASRFVQSVLALDAFPSPFNVERFGVRARFCTAYMGSFDNLLQLFKERYADLKPTAYAAVGHDANVTDAGAPFYFKDPLGDFNMHCGPMKTDQMKTFFNYKDATALPEVGFYCDIDYYIKPTEPLNVTDFLSHLSKFAQAAWDRHKRVRKAVFEG